MTEIAIKPVGRVESSLTERAMLVSELEALDGTPVIDVKPMI
jgi:tRNA (Thr-GGU) A37 N-methylase